MNFPKKMNFGNWVSQFLDQRFPKWPYSILVVREELSLSLSRAFRVNWLSACCDDRMCSPKLETLKLEDPRKLSGFWGQMTPKKHEKKSYV